MSTPTQVHGTAGGNVAATREAPTLPPPVDIHETSDGITLTADLPGVSKEQLQVHVEGNNLLIEGAFALDQPADTQPLYADVRASGYRRHFVLSRELDAQKIEAGLKDGVLTVRIPKRAELRPRRIEVHTH